jgi:hypothetical protein
MISLDYSHKLHEVNYFHVLSDLNFPLDKYEYSHLNSRMSLKLHDHMYMYARVC